MDDAYSERKQEVKIRHSPIIHLCHIPFRALGLLIYASTKDGIIVVWNRVLSEMRYDYFVYHSSSVGCSREHRVWLYDDSQDY